MKPEDQPFIECALAFAIRGVAAQKLRLRGITDISDQRLETYPNIRLAMAADSSNDDTKGSNADKLVSDFVDFFQLFETEDNDGNDVMVDNLGRTAIEAFLDSCQPVEELI